MFKKLLSIMIISMISTQLSCANVENVTFKSTPYIGFGIGYSQLRSNGKENFQSNLALMDSTQTNTQRNHSIGADIFVGYKHIFENGLLTGVDCAISWDGNRIQHTFIHDDTIRTHTRLSTPYKFIPGAIFGKRFKERYLAFVKLGVSITQFRMKNNFNVIGHGDMIVTAYRKRKTGFFGSANFAYALNNNLSTFVSFSYERYGKIKKTIEHHDPAILPDDSGSYTFRPSAMAAKVGFVISFDAFGKK